jgi:hypothetical protein
MDKEENLKIVQTKLPEKTIVYYVIRSKNEVLCTEAAELPNS